MITDHFAKFSAVAMVAVASIATTIDQCDALPLYTFVSPDGALPATAGTGLNGEIWTGVDVDTLADARSYILSSPADATFIATSVDYPNGTTGSTSTSSTFSDALGVDAASLSNPTVAATAVLNSIMRFTGYLRVDAPGSLFLGIGSDDGSELIIQGTQVINNDGIHAFPGASAGPVEVGFLSAGLFEIELLFFESQQVAMGIEFFYDSPSSGTPVPTSHLYSSLVTPPVPLPAGLPLLLGALGILGLARRRQA
ncbi:VPLPA-CTERM sorting domain-containing protein [Tropicimonas sp. IMCC6043]|uniref:VPLPA-CTERM sorting domain-containing protein n=1 Tax=Tropicimonas sp. IMCC6043 TaxID=2510645 RepID=UPI00101BCB64|nr:PA14 domain-containing protein [Tropicimonas sp. IMCC6043]RYH05834.1 VPLPA-CTERM sorting domain-containing protein [Tropicimonas sp. IMCC6043]